MSRTHKPVVAALIIAGGRSTRFWPVGRARRPKPLFSVTGNSSLLDDTISRLSPPIPPERIFVLVTENQREAFACELKNRIDSRNLIVEPDGRGTTVAIAYGSAIIEQHCGSDAVIVASPADHYIPETRAFRKTLAQAIEIAVTNGAIVVVGVKPSRAETGYGYLQAGAPLGPGFKVTRFIEKPVAERAQKMISSGQFLWNAGIFAMSLPTLKSELRRQLPGCVITEFASMNALELERVYRTLRIDSFDREIAEKSDKLACVKAKFEWHDVGSWSGLWDALRGDANNVISEGIVTEDVEGVLARGGKRLMVLLGVKDIVAVDTDDAILIANRSRSQEIPLILEVLRQRGLENYL